MPFQNRFILSGPPQGCDGTPVQGMLQSESASCVAIGLTKLSQSRGSQFKVTLTIIQSKLTALARVLYTSIIIAELTALVLAVIVRNMLSTVGHEGKRSVCLTIA